MGLATRESSRYLDVKEWVVVLKQSENGGRQSIIFMESELW